VNARRLIAPALAAVAAAGIAAAPASAAPPRLAAVVAGLQSHPVYVDPATGTSAAEKHRVLVVVRPQGSRLRVALLSAKPPEVPTLHAAATAVRQRLKSFHGTVALEFPHGLQVSAPNPRAAPVLRGIRAARGKVGAAALVAFANGYSGKINPPAPSSSKSNGSSVPTWVWIVAAIVAVLLILLLARAIGTRRRGGAKRSGGSRGGALVDEARALLGERASNVGRELAETAVPVGVAEVPEASEHHARATELLARVRGELPRLDGPPAFRRAQGALDEAEWRIAAASAALEGATPPLRPEEGRPGRCFFDVRHGLGVEEVELEIVEVRTVHVLVCAEDAHRLAEGGDPAVGVVTVGRRSLPWAAAPTWFGGWGFGQDDLAALRYEGRPVFAASLTLEALTQGAPSGSVRRVRAGGGDSAPVDSETVEHEALEALEQEEPADAFEPAEPENDPPARELPEPRPEPEDLSSLDQPRTNGGDAPSAAH
jgi:hypothetical protein